MHTSQGEKSADKILAAFRVALGLILLRDIFDKWDALGFYLGPGSAVDGFPFPPTWFDQVPGYASWVVILTGATLVFASFTLGAFTRVTHILAFVLHEAFNARMTLYEHSGTHVISLLLFCSLPLPLGNLGSVDRWKGLRPRSPFAPQWLHLPRMQLAIIYLSTSLAKAGGTAWYDGSAVYNILQSHFSKPLGRWVALQAPIPLLQFLAYSTWWIEFAGGLLLLAGVLTSGSGSVQGKVSKACFVSALLLLVPFHVALHMFVGPNDFSMIMIVGLILAIPFWSSSSRPIDLGSKWVSRVVVAFSLVFMVFAANQNVIRYHAQAWFGRTGTLQDRILSVFGRTPIGTDLFLQRWDMFRSFSTTRSYLVVRAFDGTKWIDPLNGVPASFDEPPDLAIRFPRIHSNYFRSYFQSFSSASPAPALARFYLMKMPELRSVEVYLVERAFPPLKSREQVESTSTRLLVTLTRRPGPEGEF